MTKLDVLKREYKGSLSKKESQKNTQAIKHFKIKTDNYLAKRNTTKSNQKTPRQKKTPKTQNSKQRTHWLKET